MKKGRSYEPAWWLRNGHVNTLAAGSFRRIDWIRPERQRLELPDGDFLDLDWYRQGAARIAIVLHGLEGNSDRPYVRGMARAMHGAGWDVLAWNYRGCSGEPNRLPRSYHSGETGDLRTILGTVAGYETIVLIGFSLGGNVTLKYLGEEGDSTRVSAAIAISVPCDLEASALELGRIYNQIYMRRFMRGLRTKMRGKIAQFPDQIIDQGLAQMRSFAEFDDAYTAPIHGFDGAQDYWSKCSSKRFMSGIRRRTLIINAKDDPFLPAPCYPIEAARNNPSVTLDIPRFGGHVGFYAAGPTLWTESQAVEFCSEVV